MPTLRLTDSGLRSLKTSKVQEEFWDPGFKGGGFGVRVSGTTGEKKFVLRYTVDGKRKRMTLGTYPGVSLASARERAREIVVAVDQGLDPAEEKKKRAEAPTFRELAEEYLERHAKPKKRSWRYDQRMLGGYLLDPWGDRKAAEVTRFDVMTLLDEIADGGAPYAANRVRALVSKIYSFGIKRGYVEVNPVVLVPRPASPRSRDRVLREDELGRLWKALDDKEPDPKTGEPRRLTSELMAAHFRLRLLTAQRGIEVLSMRWEDVDGDWWTIPAGVSKNKLAHRVPLPPQAKVILKALRPDSKGSEWVLPSPGGGHLRWVGKAAREIQDRVGFNWKPHDLRRTAATLMTSMGVSRLVVSKILNHVESGVTAVYDRSSYDSEKRQALILWGNRVERIVSARDEAKVVGRIG
ncbi:MAG: tyrosine-type recombinase/integrase [Gammaproteobacteria bacterium]